MKVVKELSAQWFFDYMQNKPEIVVNGFKKAGIKDGSPQSNNEDDSDPFSDCEHE